MGDLLSETTALWTIAVVLGYPVLALALVEAYRHLRAPYPELAKLINLLQVSVLPLVALHLLLSRVAEVPPDSTGAKTSPTFMAKIGPLHKVNGLSRRAGPTMDVLAIKLTPPDPA